MYVVKHNDEIIATADSVSGAVQAMDDFYGENFRVVGEISSTRYKLQDERWIETEMELIHVEHYE